MDGREEGGAVRGWLLLRRGFITLVVSITKNAKEFIFMVSFMVIINLYKSIMYVVELNKYEE